MWIQRAAIQLIGRPILIPATFVAIGASYGTFKITRGVVQLVTPGLHPADGYSRPMYLTGIVAGVSVVVLSEKLLKPLPGTGGATGAGGAVGGIAGVRDKVERALRQLRPVRRGAALVGASVLAALVVEACFYSSRQQQQQQKQQQQKQQQKQQQQQQQQQ
jgi:hypothetical protein